jgi:hypothetical protein
MPCRCKKPAGRALLQESAHCFCGFKGNRISLLIREQYFSCLLQPSQAELGWKPFYTFSEILRVERIQTLDWCSASQGVCTEPRRPEARKVLAWFSELRPRLTVRSFYQRHQPAARCDVPSRAAFLLSTVSSQRKKRLRH